MHSQILQCISGIFDILKNAGAERMKYWKNTSSTKEKKYERTGKCKPGPGHTLSLFYQFVMTLMRIRLDLPVLILADLFEVSTGSVTKFTISWIALMNQVLVPALVVWPKKEVNEGWLPDIFRKFPNVRSVIDCSEFFIDRPSNKDDQYRTYSQYKSHNTFKALLGITPSGAFNFVSDLWSGNISDKFITEKSGLLDKIEEGDEIMADRGFRIEDLLLTKKAKLIAPPFTRKSGNSKGKRLTAAEIRRTREIARVRIHVERAIQRVKCWRILKHQIPSTLANSATMIVKVVAALCNLMGPLFYNPNEGKRNKKKPLKRLQTRPKRYYLK